MSRKKTDADDATPMLDFIDQQAETAGENASGQDAPAASDASDGEPEAAQDADPMANLLSQSRVAPEVLEAQTPEALEAQTPEPPEEEASETDVEEVKPASDDGAEDVPETVSDEQGPTAEDEAEVAEAAATEPVSHVAHPVADPIETRILLREQVLKIATELEAARIGRRTAGRRLREVCEDDARGLDADDIEIDFDAAPEDRSGISFLAGLGAPKSSSVGADPIEAALLGAIKQRDRGAALKIIGDTPGAPDRAAYKDALITLRDALNAHLDE